MAQNSHPFKDWMNQLPLGPKSRHLRNSFEELNTKAANLHARAASLFERAAKLAEAAELQESLELVGNDREGQPLSEELKRDSKSTFALAEIADALGDEISEQALIYFDRLEKRIGAQRAALI